MRGGLVVGAGGALHSARIVCDAMRCARAGREGERGLTSTTVLDSHDRDSPSEAHPYAAFSKFQLNGVIS
jgi:hypothetical protein